MLRLVKEEELELLPGQFTVTEIVWWNVLGFGVCFLLWGALVKAGFVLFTIVR